MTYVDPSGSTPSTCDGAVVACEGAMVATDGPARPRIMASGTSAAMSRGSLTVSPLSGAGLVVLGGRGLGRALDHLQSTRDTGVDLGDVDRTGRRLAALGVVQRAGDQPAGVQSADLMQRCDDALPGQVLVVAGLLQHVFGDA